MRWLSETRRALELLFGPPEDRDFAVEFWDGTYDAPPASRCARFTLVLRAPGALRSMLLPPSELRLAGSYVNGVVDVRGDLEAAVGIGDIVRARLASVRDAARLIRALLSLPRWKAARPRGERVPPFAHRARKHSPRRDAAAVRAHYDLGNEFYTLWLDRSMVYSCGYFETDQDTIDAAQQAKLDLICRKLRLCPGERFLDIGCGWGGLVRRAVATYGTSGTGLTLSQPQAEYAASAIHQAGLADRCAVIVRDYRDLDDTQRFDKIASVGMSEHVGRRNLHAYFDRAYRLLSPGGLFLNHCIIELRQPERGFLAAVRRRMWHPGEFIERFIFPDGELIPLRILIGCAEAAGFEVRDVESLREHYAFTLRHWLRRFDAAEREVVRLVGPATARAWRLYLAASARAFSSGQIGLAQVLLAKRDAHGAAHLPLTRRDLYPGHRAESPPVEAPVVAPLRAGR